MVAREWADVQNSSGSTSYDRKYAERRSRGVVPKINSSDYSDHYAEKAAAREAGQREAKEYRDAVECDREWRTRYEAKERYATGNPEPHFPDASDEEYTERSTEWRNWHARKDEYLMRAEGEQIAARISRRR
ncbi:MULTISPECIES: hypothetical protein [unclassified Streptomyces]|uniref:hypothetical protein n=1 Tax=unclassified Streptomyces TaxID=2593676 RepID=UPI0034E4011F